MTIGRLWKIEISLEESRSSKTEIVASDFAHSLFMIRALAMLLAGLVLK